MIYDLRMKRLFITYLICVHAALAVLLWKTDAVPRLLAKVGLAVPGDAYVRLQDRLLSERMDPSVPSGASIFLGDSITAGLAVTAVTPDAINFGVGMQTTAQLVDAIPTFSSLARARRIFLLIGINDLGFGLGDALVANLHKIADKLPSDIPVVWSSIMPHSGLTARIRSVNSRIRALCKARPQCTFVDTFSKMATDGGEPAPGIYIDGTHPNARGYALWITLMKNAIKPE